MNAELKETRELCKALTQFLGNYLQTTRGTSDAAAAEKAAGRVTDALTDCLSKTTIELGQSEDGESRIENSFECKTCGALHDLAGDQAALLSGNFRWAVPHGTREDRERPVAEHVVLMRAFRYSAGHAKEVVRQLELVTLMLWDAWRGRVHQRQLADQTRRRFETGDQS